MSPAHSSHSMSPTQSLGPGPDSDVRTHPFPTPPNSLPQHHHSPSNSTTPHSGQSTNMLHSDYPMAPNAACTTPTTSQGMHQNKSSDSGTLPSTSTATNPTMLRSALTVGADRRQQLHHHHHHLHHHGGSGQIPVNHMGAHGRTNNGLLEDMSDACDDIDVNVMPIVSQEFPSELCEVSRLVTSYLGGL